MIPAAELKVRVAIEGIPSANTKLTSFEGNLKRVSGYDATATLQANVEGAGFDEYRARIEGTRLATARPITQTVRADVDQRSFAATLAEVAALKKQVDSAHGGGLFSGIGGVLTPLGKLPSLAALASPEILALGGAAGALSASLSEAALGAGALAGAGLGSGAVGLAGIVAVAAPAVAGLKELTKAQKSYIQSVEQYGVQSTEAETAARKLRAAERGAGKEAVEVVRGLDSVKERWGDLTKPGREAFLGALSDGLDHLDAKLPVLASSANRSTKSMRRDFNQFLTEITGKGTGFNRFVEDMTGVFVHEGPMITQILADWGKVFEHLAIAADPSLEEVTEDFSDFSDNLLHSTDNAPKLRREVSGLVDQTMSWVHLLTQSGDLLITLFGAGDGQGQRLVEDMTGKVEEWKDALEANPENVEGFFEHSVETTRELGQVLSMLAEQWFVIAQAMEPVDHLIHDVATGLNSIRIGNFSALTGILTTIAAVGIAKKVLELKELLGAYSGIRKVLQGEATITQILAGAEAEAAAATNAQAAATERLAVASQGAAAAQGELLIANSSGAVVGTASTVAAGGAGAAEGAAAGGILAGAKGVLGKGMRVLGGVAGGYFAAEFGAKAIQGITGADLLENQNLAEALTHGFNTSHVAGTEVDALQESRGEYFDLSQAQLKHLGRQFQNTMTDLSVSAAGGMGKIDGILGHGLDLVDRKWKVHTEPWRDHTAAAMQQAVIAIETGMDNGTISVERGQKRINQLLGQIHLLRGDDPFGLAAATAKSFKEANQITAQGTNAWIRKLEAMPRGAARTSAESTQEMLAAWADGHPKIEHQVDALTRMELRKFGASNKQLREGVEKGATGPVAEAFQEAASGVGGALENIGVNTDRLLKALGLHSIVDFQALVLGPHRSPQLRGQAAANAHHHASGYQEGGVIPGVTEGDSVHRLVRPRTFILNREATRAHGFDKGGMVPVVLEPGEREFTPEEVDRIGLHNLVAMNEAVPRFGYAEGGTVEVSGPGVLGRIGHAALEKAVAGANKFIAAHQPKPAAGMGGPAGPVPPGSVRAWLTEALKITGHFSPANLSALYGRAMQESSGNPHAINLTDSNAAEGHPSKGLLQTIPETFAAYKMRGHGDIWDPVDNAIAAIRYMYSRYGHIVGPSSSGYARGGEVTAGRKHKPPHRHPTPPVGSPEWIESLSARDFAGRIAPDVAAPRDELSRFEALRSQGALHLITGGEALEIPTVIHPPKETQAEKERKKGPSTLDKIVKRMAELNGIPYPHPDQHFGLKLHPAFLDCSAAVSNALWAGGLLDTELTSTGLMSWGAAGPGKDLTVFANAGHAFLEVLGRLWGTSVDDGGAGGLGYHPRPAGWDSYSAGFMKRHWPGSLGDVKGITAGNSKPAEPSAVHGKYTQQVATVTDHRNKAGVPGFVEQHRQFTALTAALSFGSLPETVKGCTKELRLRQRQLAEYRAAVRQTQDKQTKHGLEVNVAALERRITHLRQQRDRLLRAEKVKKAVATINETAEFKAWTGPGGVFDQRESAYNEFSERAEQTVSLEPEEPRDVTADWINGALRSYVEGVETPAYRSVLGSEADWRNAILNAEQQAGERVSGWQSQIAHLHENIEEIQALRKDHPRAYAKHKGDIPGMRSKIDALRGVIQKTRTETLPEWEDTLGQVQGLGRTHERMASLPGEPTDQFGGSIFATQLTIHELGLKVPNALAGLPTPEGPDRTQQLELELQLSTQANQRLAIENALIPTLRQFEATYPLPYMGAFAEGGVALVGERGPELAHFPSGTRVHTANDTERMLGGGDVFVQVNGEIRQAEGDTRDPIEVYRHDPRFGQMVREWVGSTPRGLSVNGPGRAYRP